MRIAGKKQKLIPSDPSKMGTSEKNHLLATWVATGGYLGEEFIGDKLTLSKKLGIPPISLVERIIKIRKEQRLPTDDVVALELFLTGVQDQLMNFSVVNMELDGVFTEAFGRIIKLWDKVPEKDQIDLTANLVSIMRLVSQAKLQLPSKFAELFGKFAPAIVPGYSLQGGGSDKTTINVQQGVSINLPPVEEDIKSVHEGIEKYKKQKYPAIDNSTDAKEIIERDTGEITTD